MLKGTLEGTHTKVCGDWGAVGVLAKKFLSIGTGVDTQVNLRGAQKKKKKKKTEKKKKAEKKKKKKKGPGGKTSLSSGRQMRKVHRGGGKHYQTNSLGEKIDDLDGTLKWGKIWTCAVKRR